MIDCKKWAREFAITYGGTLSDRAFTSFVQALERVLRRIIRDAITEEVNRATNDEVRGTLAKLAAQYAGKDKS